MAAGRRRHFHIYDVATSTVERVSALLDHPNHSVESFAACPSSSNPLVAFLGNDGSVPLVSLRSRQSIGALKMNGTVRTAAFTSDGAELLTSGGHQRSNLLAAFSTTVCTVAFTSDEDELLTAGG